MNARTKPMSVNGLVAARIPREVMNVSAPLVTRNMTVVLALLQHG